MYLKNPYYMQTEENWLQKPLHYSVLKFLQHFRHFQSCNKIKVNFRQLIEAQQVGFNILHNSNHSCIIHLIPPILFIQHETEMYTILPGNIPNQSPYL